MLGAFIPVWYNNPMNRHEKTFMKALMDAVLTENERAAVLKKLQNRGEHVGVLKDLWQGFEDPPGTWNKGLMHRLMDMNREYENDIPPDELALIHDNVKKVGEVLFEDPNFLFQRGIVIGYDDVFDRTEADPTKQTNTGYEAHKKLTEKVTTNRRDLTSPTWAAWERANTYEAAHALNGIHTLEQNNKKTKESFEKFIKAAFGQDVDQDILDRMKVYLDQAATADFATSAVFSIAGGDSLEKGRSMTPGEGLLNAHLKGMAMGLQIDDSGGANYDPARTYNPGTAHTKLLAELDAVHDMRVSLARDSVDRIVNDKIAANNAGTITNQNFGKELDRSLNHALGTYKQHQPLVWRSLVTQILKEWPEAHVANDGTIHFMDSQRQGELDPHFVDRRNEFQAKIGGLTPDREWKSKGCFRNRATMHSLVGSTIGDMRKNYSGVFMFSNMDRLPDMENHLMLSNVDASLSLTHFDEWTRKGVEVPQEMREIVERQAHKIAAKGKDYNEVKHAELAKRADKSMAGWWRAYPDVMRFFENCANILLGKNVQAMGYMAAMVRGLGDKVGIKQTQQDIDDEFGPHTWPTYATEDLETYVEDVTSTKDFMAMPEATEKRITRKRPIEEERQEYYNRIYETVTNMIRTDRQKKSLVWKESDAMDFGFATSTPFPRDSGEKETEYKDIIETEARKRDPSITLDWADAAVLDTQLKDLGLEDLSKELTKIYGQNNSELQLIREKLLEELREERDRRLAYIHGKKREETLNLLGIEEEKSP